jgi:hypothetical protein
LSWKRREPSISSALGRHAETLAALCATALEHDAPILGLHPDEEAVSAPAAAAIGLKRTFHENSLGKLEELYL